MDLESPGNSKSARTLRRESNKDSNEFVIKCGLDKILSLDQNFKNEFKKTIQKRVITTSKAAQRLSFLMNLFLRERINKVKDPRKIIIDESIFNVTFLFQLITGTDRSIKPNILASEICSKFENFVYKVDRKTYDANSLVTVASEYSKNFKVYLQENIKRNQLAFIRTWVERHSLPKSRIQVLLNSINGWGKSIELSKEEHRMVSFHRELLNLKENEFLSKVYLKTNYSKVVIYFSVLSKYLTKNCKKSLTIAPISKIKTSFIYIDKKVLAGIFKESRIPFEADTIYDIFKINSLLTKRQHEIGFKFTGTIQTDSVAINFHFRRPNLKSKIEAKASEHRVIANDPGRSTLFFGVEEVSENKFKKYTLTRRQFYHETGAKEATKRANKWNTDYLGPQLDELSKTNSKSVKMHHFLQHVSVVNKHYSLFWSEASKKKWSRQRLALYSSKKKVYAKFFESFKNGDDRKIIIAYGDAGFASTSKYEIAAPTTTLEKECSKRYKIVKIDEFRTTKLHYQTGEILSKVQNADKKTIRGLLWYNSTKASKFVNRDLNAAKNILHCYNIFPNRPPGMSRKDIIQVEPVIKILPSSLLDEDLVGTNFVRLSLC